MAYDNPKCITYSFGNFDFGGGAAEALAIKGPSGMKGRILDMHASASEVFATDATAGTVKLGSAAGGAQYGTLTIPDGTADTDSYNTWTRGATAVLPADTQVEVTLTNGTDAGAVTGQAYITVTIMWYND